MATCNVGTRLARNSDRGMLIDSPVSVAGRSALDSESDLTVYRLERSTQRRVFQENKHTCIPILQKRPYGRLPGLVKIYVTALEEMADVVRSDGKAHLLPRRIWNALDLNGGGEHVGEDVRVHKWNELVEVSVDVRELGEPPHDVDIILFGPDVLGCNVNCHQ